MSKKKTDILKETYQQLEPHLKQVLEAKALFYELPNKTTFGTEITKYNILLPNGRKLNTSNSRDLCIFLQEKGFLDSSSHNVIPELRGYLSVKALEKDNQRRKKNLEIVNSATLNGDNLYKSAYQYESSYDKAKIHQAIHLNKSELFNDQQDPEENLAHHLSLIVELWSMYFFTEVDLAWLETRHDKIKAYICCAKLYCLISGKGKSRGYAEILDFYNKQKFEIKNSDALLYLMTQIDIALGDIERAKDHTGMMRDTSSPYYLSAMATCHVFTNDLDTALDLYKISVTEFKKIHKKRNWCLDNIFGIFYLYLVLYYQDKPLDVIKNLRHINKQMYSLSEDFRQPFEVLFALAYLKSNQKRLAEDHLMMVKQGSDCLLYCVLYQIVRYVSKPKLLNKQIPDLQALLKKTINEGAGLAEKMTQELLMIAGKETIFSPYLQDSQLRLLDYLAVREEWEYTIGNLEALIIDNKPVSGDEPENDKRLVWLFKPDPLRVDVLEQKYGKSGWSKGRKVSYQKLYNQPAQYDYLTDQDRLALSGMVEDSADWYGHHSYYLEGEVAAPHLIGHPYIFHYDNPAVRIDLVKGEAEVYIEEKGTGYKISTSHSYKYNRVVVEQESANRYKVITLSPDYIAIDQLLPKNGLSLPAKSKERVLGLVQKAKKGLNIHTNQIRDINIPEVKPNYIPVVQMLPVAEDIQLSIWMKPFGNQGQLCLPAQGKQELIAVIQEEGQQIRKKVVRNFAQEEKVINELLRTCPSIASYQEENNIYLIDDLGDILEILSELEQVKLANKVMIEWPQGEKYKIANKANAANMSMNISSGEDWFEFSGEIKISDGLVLEMQALLSALENNETRFIALNNGEFLELTSSFRKQLGMLANIANDNKIYSLGSGVLADIAKQIDQLTVDTGWENHVKKLRHMEKHVPKIPSTLQAELRDYQEDGFRYLSRLAHWNIGACLADDMGLGKTVQSIALMLEYASKGATLVIAPTSVCFNWATEINKFAPTLTIHSMYNLNKADSLKNIGKMDVVICSYGLLHHNTEMLADKSWQTIILDEAQAIKNPNTKRWHAVMKLKGKIRVALTGTPIENHLGELWSITNFMNPGMLGNQKIFQQKYAIPIEQQKNTEKLQALKAVVHPYILRRLKSEVLDELPPKTEQTIYIEPTAEEAAFYEALRISALDKISSLDYQQSRIQILAEISKLRQACCDSGLVSDETTFENSKLKQFKKTMRNIIDNGHKVLVFSQFVRFLDKVRALLDEDSVSYQYIDGSTPQTQRKKRVERFQSGEGDAFLLSLKAGGSGLNLTAADYVIHLDPWWNPAVEDQASDRAHRIGQERPVTIYRLVMKNTIEEKIIYLHKGKRALANDLLSGQDLSGKMSEEALMGLISSAS
ncbi:SNF2-related protein [Francisellaceae bacterium]|nr:SNF2-related protein [Francisellaceae bacterium]